MRGNDTKRPQTTLNQTNPTAMTSSAAQPHRSLAAASIGRSSLTIFILSTCALYVLYSSNLIFLSHHHHQQQQQDSPLCSSSAAAANLSSVEDYDPAPTPPTPPGLPHQHHDTELRHIVFAIAASAGLWDKRKEYIKTWWRPGKTRGVAWLDRPVKVRRGEGLPEVRISGDTSRFGYANRQGRRAALRISRVVSETLRLGMEDVRWFVMGDDDTVFVAENVARALSKYDHRGLYYVGSSSESHVQNIFFSYGMAYGGGVTTRQVSTRTGRGQLLLF